MLNNGLSRGLSSSNLMSWISRVFLKSIGWHVEGIGPDIKKYVLVAAPHTSNWDFPMTLAVASALKLKIHWMGKATMFHWPFRRAMLWLGGIPVNRDQASNIVGQSIQAFQKMDEFIMLIAPEGTRKKVNYWKTGFYRIAQGANIPIVLAFMDYRRKAGGIGPTFYPTGNMEEDMLYNKPSTPTSPEAP